MPNPRILLIVPPSLPPGAARERLRSSAPGFVIDQHSAEERPLDEGLWEDTEILYTVGGPLPTPEQAPRLRWVQLNSAGVEHALASPLFKGGRVRLTSISGIHAIPIPEYVFTMLLAWTHRVPRLLQLQAARTWPPEEQRDDLLPDELFGKTMGVVGYGTIGRQTARIAAAFGMHILAIQRGTEHRDTGYQIEGVGDPQGTLPDRYFTPHQLHEMLGLSDVVVLALPLTAHTRHLIDEAALRAMKPAAFLINIARGGIVDEKALVRALQERWIGGAGLDVTEEEPLPASSPLWHLPNVLLSPHLAGSTPHYMTRALTLFAENLRRYLAHEPLLNEATIARGY